MNKLSSFFVTLLILSVSTLSFADSRCGFKVNSHPKEVTTRNVIDFHAEITRVFRLDDGSWLFLNEPSDQYNGLVGTTIEELVQRDPTLCSIHDLPHGWIATRANKNEKWVRSDGQ
ncbi:MAG: hypothetical protein CVV11_15985 [Gammaproteobacteria bacterium HGW-Gammaproteobacteria-15]|nr:MAG: hypothetical protein CVV11_15985 [Gammaproteobacteria bacterium HGW-Gammaproteobacteria-15]